MKDTSWLEECESRYFEYHTDLEHRLVTAKSALDQQQIAALEKEYGDLLCRRGLFIEGVKHYTRMREYSKDPDDVMNMLHSATICSFHMKNYFAVINHARKMDMLSKGSQDSMISSKVRLVAALTHVAMGKFEEAARMAPTIRHDAMVSSQDIVSPSSFALCIILSAISSIERKELETLGSSSGFQAILDLAPAQAYDAFLAVRLARHGQVLSLLEELKPLVWIDYVLQPHMTSLYEMIHDRCLCEYSSVFSRINLRYMADRFKLEDRYVGSQRPSNGHGIFILFQFLCRELENRLAKLIGKGLLNAKIDALAQELILQNTSLRSQTFDKAIEAAAAFIRDSSYVTLTSQMIRSGLTKSATAGPPKSIDPEERLLSLQAQVGGEGHALQPTASTQDTAEH